MKSNKVYYLVDDETINDLRELKIKLEKHFNFKEEKKEPENTNEIITGYANLSKYLGISIGTIRNRIRRGIIKPYQIENTRRVFFLKHEVKRAIFGESNQAIINKHYCNE